MKKHLLIAVLAVIAAVSAPVAPAAKGKAETLYCDDGFNGSTFLYNEEVTVDYAYKTNEEYVIAGAVPRYSDQTELKNTCAPIGGTIAMGYFDLTYDEVIPSFTAGVVKNGKIFYKAQTESVNQVFNYLYTAMGTNTNGNGTTAEGYRKGMQQYLNSVGRKIAFTSCFNSGSVNSAQVKQAVSDKKIGVMFTSKYNYITIKTDYGVSSTRDQFQMNYYGGTHVLTMYGYRQIRYFDKNDNLLLQYTFLAASTGYADSPLAYILLDSHTNVVEGYIMTVS